MAARKLILHATAPLEMLKPLLHTLKTLGIQCERRDYELRGINTPDELHLLWGMRYRPPIYQELARQENIYFLENGWFTQSTGCYLDKLGPNGLSSIRGACRELSLDSNKTSNVRVFIERLHRQVHLKPVTGQGDYLFLPLQVERDSQLLFWSECPAPYPKRQLWFVDQVCKAFPRERIVIRSHPRDRATAERIRRSSESVRRHRGVVFRSDGSTYDWLAGCRAVVGINSTVLLEALTLYKPVCAMGVGVFTDNDVVLECFGNARLLSRALSFAPSIAKISRFLELLLSRQIPYTLCASDTSNYPILQGLVAQILD